MSQALADTKFEGPLRVDAIVDYLVEEGLLTADDARLTKTLAKGTEHRDTHALKFIAKRNITAGSGRKLTMDFLTQWLADKVGLPYRRIDPLKIDVPVVTAVVSHAYAAHFNILPIDVTDKAVTFAVSEPYIREWEQELETILRKDIVRCFSSPDQIQRYLAEFYSLSRSVRSATKDETHGARSGVQNLEQLVELGRVSRLEANDQHVVNIVDWLLQYAFDQRASDIHLEPRREHGSVRFRIDGVLHNVYEIPAAVMAAVSSRIKIVGRMDVAEKRRPQDGRLKTRDQEGREVELRLSTMPTAFGEKLVMRIFNPDVLVKTAIQLGFSRAENEVWQELVDNSHGIVLVTGPTGSGKTTTLYSTLKHLAVPEINVSTIEDPIELVMDEFNQMQVQPNIGLDFASGVRTLLRQDPDVIMVGEIRDLETAEMATQAALTGHLVLSTLHTNDAPSTITRLMELGVPPYLINATLLGVVAQRLSRTLCPNCRTVTSLDAHIWRDMVRPWSSKAPAQINKAAGCLECRNTGYMGRTGIYEILKISPLIRGLITEAADIADIRRTAVQEGMKPLRLSGAHKVAAGLTTVEEVLRVTPPPSGA
jgi:general secretion pathway protein E